LVYLAAVSGGADSVAMLAALAALMSRTSPAGFPGGGMLRCIHVDHGLRPPEESGADAEYVRQFCGRLNISCTVVCIPHGEIAAFARAKGIGIEAAARIYRHRSLVCEARRLESTMPWPRETAVQKDKTVRILIAHTRSDALETTLIRILRGAGPAGLAEMPASRGRILRPMLSFERADIIRYLRDKNIQWREDASNADEHFLRNRIRRSLVPLLDEKFPAWKPALAALSQTQARAAEFIAEETGKRVQWLRDRDGSYSTGAGNFFSQPAILREEALFRGCDVLVGSGEWGPHAPYSIQRAAVRNFCSGGQKAADLGPARVVCSGGLIRLTKSKKQVFDRGFCLLIKEPGLVTLKGVTVAVQAGYDPSDRTEGSFPALLPLVVRKSVKEDRIIAGKKKVRAGGFSSRVFKKLITAADQSGTCALICREKTGRAQYWFREPQPSGAAQEEYRNYYTVTVSWKTGSTHAEQSE